MKYDDGEDCTGGPGLADRLDPRVKVIAAFGFILSVVLTPPGAYWAYAGYGAMALGAVACSKIRLSFVLRRMAVVAPFIAAALVLPFVTPGQTVARLWLGTHPLSLSREGLVIFGNISIKSLLSVLAAVVLAGSTPWPRLLRGVEKMKCPKPVVSILSFMYRYSHIIGGELESMRRAKSSRTVGGSRWFHTRVLANILGTLFVRSYERGERVYQAMTSRGFDGKVRTLNELRLETRDFFFLAMTIAVLAGLRVAMIWL